NFLILKDAWFFTLGSFSSDCSFGVVVGCDEFRKGGSRVPAPDLVVIAKVDVPDSRILHSPIHEAGKLVLKLTSDDLFRTTFNFSFLLAISPWLDVFILIEFQERGVIIDVPPQISILVQLGYVGRIHRPRGLPRRDLKLGNGSSALFCGWAFPDAALVDDSSLLFDGEDDRILKTDRVKERMFS
ncbi:hypothetical protein Tco_1550049, partial [Tanacetum coccineum]